MGDLERRAKTQRIQGNVQKAVLVTVGTVGILSVMLVAPKIFRALKMFGIKPSRINDKTRSATQKLLEKGLLVLEKKDNKPCLRLSEKGKVVLEQIMFRQESKEQRKKRWDKQWRLVVFDIPESRRKARNQLRDMLIRVGFIKIQNSVWVHPYDCEELVVLLKSDLRLGREVLYVIVQIMENDIWLRKHFDLPLP